ncbi:hypothetical protein NUU61_004919 [Penicillium alfredii]|uniref:Calcofluor white hypersensitive protein n=1 Tax=Penicillium alfredii TaxID=1506179 RepID=A0A9W9K729_9EURO|nr:uncharacterized protein NUU61_004919 [Penicillium alfredii]KAJ5095563.1 hypothetical protein NUU61_004919 [Penicillium alfredii]
MSKNRTGLYLGLAAAGAGGYYMYRAGGNVGKAKKEMKFDAEKAREKLPHGNEAVTKGEDVGKEAGAAVDEAINNARTKTKLDERIPEITQDGKNKIDEFRQDTRNKINAGVDKVDRTVEQKAADAKGTVSGWLGGRK